MGKRLRAIVLLVVFAILVLISRNIEAKENESGLISGTVTQLEDSVTAYEQKDTSSKVIAEFSEGDSVYVTNVDDSWAEIFFKGETGYIPLDQIGHENIAAAEKSAEEIGQAIDAELTKNDIETSAGIDNYLRKKNQELSAIIWKIAIGAFVVVIIVASVIIGRMNKAESKEKDPEVKQEKKDEEVKNDETVNENDDVTDKEKESVNETDCPDSVL